MENSQEQVLSRKWTLFKNQKIGEGAYGKVYKGKENATGKIVAIKKNRVQENSAGLPSTDEGDPDDDGYQ